MKKFKFSLESLLELRLREEREALHKLGFELEAQVKARKLLDMSVAASSSCRSDIQSEINESRINANALRNYNLHLERLEGLEDQSRHDLKAAHEAVKKAKEVYYKKKAEADILLKLRERSFSEYMNRLEKIEAMETDDLVLVRHAQKEKARKQIALAR